MRQERLEKNKKPKRDLVLTYSYEFISISFYFFLKNWGMYGNMCSRERFWKLAHF